MWKKAVLLAALGYVLGVLVGVVFFLSDPSGGLAAAIPYLILSGIPGAAAMGSSVIYDIEQWSIARATVTHFLITFGCYYLLSLSLGWFRFGDRIFWIVTAAMVIIYIIIWLIMYLSYRRQIRKMNDELRRLKQEQDKE